MSIGSQREETGVPVVLVRRPWKLRESHALPRDGVADVEVHRPLAKNQNHNRVGRHILSVAIHRTLGFVLLPPRAIPLLTVPRCCVFASLLKLVEVHCHLLQPLYTAREHVPHLPTSDPLARAKLLDFPLSTRSSPTSQLVHYIRFPHPLSSFTAPATDGRWRTRIQI